MHFFTAKYCRLVLTYEYSCCHLATWHFQFGHFWLEQRGWDRGRVSGLGCRKSFIGSVGPFFPMFIWPANTTSNYSRRNTSYVKNELRVLIGAWAWTLGWHWMGLSLLFCLSGLEESCNVESMHPKMLFHAAYYKSGGHGNHCGILKIVTGMKRLIKYNRKVKWETRRQTYI